MYINNLKSIIMNSQFNLNIKTPCSENFNKFSPTPGGGFCGSCKKEVIDFTKMNAQETITYFKNHSTQNTCGRFKNTQLKTYTQKRKKLSFLSSVGIACLSVLSIFTAQAQDTKKQKVSLDSNTKEVNVSEFQKSFIVKGNVSDESIPLPGVNILLEGTTTGTTTDFDGNFQFPIKLKKGDVLVFSYIGMESQKVTIMNENSASNIELKIDMKMDSCLIMGKVAVKEVYKSKRN